ncbi:MAG: heterocyst frequency control protein PatD [Leptolyngbya sp. RL_3_1]|nr:heterocyst frequency control protein PatD [Leptolyngbya sp. RL_3_1]
MAPKDNVDPKAVDPNELVRDWLNQVQRLQAIATAPNPEGAELRQRLAAVQQLAQQQILTLQAAVPPPGGGFSPVAFQTEISRTLRLVAIDIQFLAMTRQAAKHQARQAQLGDRLTQLLNQGQGLLQVLNGPPQEIDREQQTPEDSE